MYLVYILTYKDHILFKSQLKFAIYVFALQVGTRHNKYMYTEKKKTLHV